METKETLVFEGTIVAAHERARRVLESRLRAAWTVTDKVLRTVSIPPATQFSVGFTETLFIQYDATVYNNLVVGWTTGDGEQTVIHEMPIRQLFLCDGPMSNVYLRNTQSAGGSSVAINVKYIAALVYTGSEPEIPGVTSLTAENILAVMQAATTDEKQELADIICAYLNACIDSRISESPVVEARLENRLAQIDIPLFDLFGNPIGMMLPYPYPA